MLRPPFCPQVWFCASQTHVPSDPTILCFRFSLYSRTRHSRNRRLTFVSVTHRLDRSNGKITAIIMSVRKRNARAYDQQAMTRESSDRSTRPPVSVHTRREISLLLSISANHLEQVAVCDEEVLIFNF